MCVDIVSGMRQVSFHSFFFCVANAPCWMLILRNPSAPEKIAVHEAEHNFCDLSSIASRRLTLFHPSPSQKAIICWWVWTSICVDIEPRSSWTQVSHFTLNNEEAAELYNMSVLWRWWCIEGIPFCTHSFDHKRTSRRYTFLVAETVILLYKFVYTARSRHFLDGFLKRRQRLRKQQEQQTNIFFYWQWHNWHF